MSPKDVKKVLASKTHVGDSGPLVGTQGKSAVDRLKEGRINCRQGSLVPPIPCLRPGALHRHDGRPRWGGERSEGRLCTAAAAPTRGNRPLLLLPVGPPDPNYGRSVSVLQASVPGVSFSLSSSSAFSLPAALLHLFPSPPWFLPLSSPRGPPTSSCR